MKNNFKSNYAKYLCGIITEEQFYEALNDNQSTRTGGLASSPMASSPMVGSSVTLTDRDPNHQEKMQSRFDSAIRGFQSFLHLHDDELIGLFRFNKINVMLLGTGYFSNNSWNGTGAEYKTYFPQQGNDDGLLHFIRAVHHVVLGQPVYEDLLSILETLNKDKYKSLIKELNDRYQHFTKQPDQKLDNNPFVSDNLPKLIDDIIKYRPKS
jgi:hypothetical protein